MSAIEENFVRATKFKRPESDFNERQDYLAALVRKLSGMGEAPADEAMSKLSDDAYDWYCKAVEAMNVSEDIPDFDDVEPEAAEPEEAEPEEGEFEEEEPDEEEGEEPEPIEEEEPEERAGVAEALAVAEGTADGEITITDQGIEEVVKEDERAADDGYDETAGSAEAAAETAEEWEPSKTQGTPKRKQSKEVKAEAKAKKAAKAKAKAEGKPVSKIATPESKAKPKKGKEGPKLDRRKLYAEVVPQYTKLDGKKNRYGIIIGTKRDHAIKMFEQGVRMREVDRVCGDEFYNMLKQLKKEGHRVEKLQYGELKLTHRDDLPKRKGK